MNYGLKDIETGIIYLYQRKSFISCISSRLWYLRALLQRPLLLESRNLFHNRSERRKLETQGKCFVFSLINNNFNIQESIERA